MSWLLWTLARDGTLDITVCQSLFYVHLKANIHIEAFTIQKAYDSTGIMHCCVFLC